MHLLMPQPEVELLLLLYRRPSLALPLHPLVRAWKVARRRLRQLPLVAPPLRVMMDSTRQLSLLPVVVKATVRVLRAPTLQMLRPSSMPLQAFQRRRWLQMMALRPRTAMLEPRARMRVAQSHVVYLTPLCGPPSPSSAMLARAPLGW